MNARTREGRALLLAFLLASAVFTAAPGLDLWVAAHFHSGGGRFPVNDWWAVDAVYKAVPWVGRLLFLGSLLLLAVAGLHRVSVSRRQWRRGAALALTLLLGVGLLVHGVFKEHWGRARPRDVTAFHGTLAYTPALQPSRECPRNCSFVSGHAATGFALVSLGLFGAPATRRRWWAIGGAAGAGLGLMRVVQGDHFLSDIVFAGLLIGGGCWALREVWLRVMRRRQLERRRAMRLRADGNLADSRDATAATKTTDTTDPAASERLHTTGPLASHR